MIAFDEYRPEGAVKGVVVGVHGFGGSRKSQVLLLLGEKLKKLGYMMITFDLPCHGERRSEQSLSLAECMTTVGEAMEYARSFGVPVSVFATSFGAYLTLLHIAKTGASYAHVVLRAPAVYMREVFLGLLTNRGLDPQDKLWNMSDDLPLYVDEHFLEELTEHSLDSYDYRIVDLTVIQGRRDRTVDPIANADFFARKFGRKARMRYFAKGDHFYTDDREREKAMRIAIRRFRKGRCPFDR